MTDNEIMKNVRCCADRYCKGCSLQEKPYCRYTLLSLAWNTMQNQKAEIERLQKYNTDVAHKHYNDGIKEFANRLKEKVYPFPCAIGVEYAVTIRAINDLVKEMAGEDK